MYILCGCANNLLYVLHVQKYRKFLFSLDNISPVCSLRYNSIVTNSVLFLLLFSKSVSLKTEKKCVR